MPVVQRLTSLIENLTKDIPGKDPDLPYVLKVVIPGKHVTPRHPMFQYLLYIGSALLVPILKHQEIDIGKDGVLDFVLPERYLSVHEQQLFLQRLKTHPQAKEIKLVRVITQNVLIVSGCLKECIGIFDIDASDPDSGETVN